MRQEENIASESEENIASESEESIASESEEGTASESEEGIASEEDTLTDLLNRAKETLEDFELNDEANLEEIETIIKTCFEYKYELVGIGCIKMLECFTDDAPLTQEILNKLITESNFDKLYNFYFIIRGLSEAKLLTKENIERVLGFDDEYEILSTFAFTEPERFTQEMLIQITSGIGLEEFMPDPESLNACKHSEKIPHLLYSVGFFKHSENLMGHEQAQSSLSAPEEAPEGPILKKPRIT